jgi:hypothetical protein
MEIPKEISEMLDTAIKDGRKLTPGEVERLLQDPFVQDALKDPLARFGMLKVHGCSKLKRVIKKLAGKGLTK